jgi:hypothetical protein
MYFLFSTMHHQADAQGFQKVGGTKFQHDVLKNYFTFRSLCWHHLSTHHQL